MGCRNGDELACELATAERFKKPARHQSASRMANQDELGVGVSGVLPPSFQLGQYGGLESLGRNDVGE